MPKDFMKRLKLWEPRKHDNSYSKPGVPQSSESTTQTLSSARHVRVGDIASLAGVGVSFGTTQDVTAVLERESSIQKSLKQAQESATAESILQEAHRLTHGSRGADYGHPIEVFQRTADLFNAIVGKKLKEKLSAHDMALAMICVKLSRQVNKPKRDNMVDAAGYAWVANSIIEETERRKNVAV